MRRTSRTAKAATRVPKGWMPKLLEVLAKAANICRPRYYFLEIAPADFR
jgi:hypothetical protein